MRLLLQFKTTCLFRLLQFKTHWFFLFNSSDVYFLGVSHEINIMHFFIFALLSLFILEAFSNSISHDSVSLNYVDCHVSSFFVNHQNCINTNKFTLFDDVEPLFFVHSNSLSVDTEAWNTNMKQVSQWVINTSQLLSSLFWHLWKAMLIL